MTAATTANPILCVQNLSKGFYLHDREKRVPAATPVSFDVGQGEVAVLTGPSGAGKSSLLKAIYRTYLPSSGSVLYHAVDGDVVDLASASEARITLLRRREIGFVTQFLHCLPRLTTLDVVARPLLKQGVPRIKAHARAAEVLGLLGLPEQLWDVAPATFSGGERQRVNIARSFAQLPRLILLDEPTASLDAVSRDQVIGLIEATRQRGVAIVAIFHDTGIADRLADIRVEVTNALATPA